MPVVIKKDVWVSGSLKPLACDKKEHSLLKGRSASAARALRRRNDPMVIAVRRRRDKNAPEGPALHQNNKIRPAPPVYTNIP